MEGISVAATTIGPLEMLVIPVDFVCVLIRVFHNNISTIAEWKQSGPSGSSSAGARHDICYFLKSKKLKGKKRDL